MIRLTRHAQRKMAERLIDESEISQTLDSGQNVGTSGRRLLKRRLFTRGYQVEGRFFPHKEITVIYIEEEEDATIVITAIARYGRWESQQ